MATTYRRTVERDGEVEVFLRGSFIGRLTVVEGGYEDAGQPGVVCDDFQQAAAALDRRALFVKLMAESKSARPVERVGGFQI